MSVLSLFLLTLINIMKKKKRNMKPIEIGLNRFKAETKRIGIKISECLTMIRFRFTNRPNKTSMRSRTWWTTDSNQAVEPFFFIVFLGLTLSWSASVKKSTLIQATVYKHLIKGGSIYSISGFDVTQSNLYDSPLSIWLNRQIASPPSKCVSSDSWRLSFCL